MLLTETMTWDEALLFGQEAFYVGDSVYTLGVDDSFQRLTKNGEVFLPDDAYFELNPVYMADNLLIRYRLGTEGDNQKLQDTNSGVAADIDIESEAAQVVYEQDKCILAMPDGSLIDIPNGRYLTAMNDFLLYIDENGTGSPHDVWVYDIPTGESYLLQADMDV